jgi:predicted nuclease of predicted toxin-antitoxin system
MKLLFDHNLSPQLVKRLSDVFPDANHVAPAGLAEASDVSVWLYARDHGCTIVTKDSDFSDLSVLRGSPPKVIWLRLGNCTTRQIEDALRRNHDEVVFFVSDPAATVLEIH